MYFSGPGIRNGLRGAVLCGLAAALLAALPAAATANTVSRTDRGGVNARGLTSKERRALDIDKVTAIGSPAGLMVAVDLKGNAERRLGRGHLKRAVVAVLLEPKSRSARPSVLATRGRGPVGQTLRITKTTDVAVTRDGDRLVFTILGGGLENVRRVEVRTFARARVRGATRAQLGGLPRIFGGGARVGDRTALPAVEVNEETCASVSAMRAEKLAEIERAEKDAEAAETETLDLRAEIDRIEDDLFAEEAKEERANKQKVRRLRRQLRLAYGDLEAAQARKAELDKLIETLERQEHELFLKEEEVICDVDLEIFGQDHGAMGFGNVCVRADTNFTGGSATLTLEGPPGSVQEPVTQTVPLDGNGNAAATWRVFDPNATYTVRGSATGTGDQGTVELPPRSLNFTDVNSQGRDCGPQ